MRGILNRDGIDFHAQALAGSCVTHDRFGANLSFLDKEVKIK